MNKDKLIEAYKELEVLFLKGVSPFSTDVPMVRSSISSIEAEGGITDGCIKNVPKEIYLCVGFNKDEETDVNFDDLHEVSWSNSREFGADIKYILASQPTPLSVQDKEEDWKAELWALVSEWDNQPNMNNWKRVEDFVTALKSQSVEPKEQEAEENEFDNRDYLQEVILFIEKQFAIKKREAGINVLGVENTDLLAVRYFVMDLQDEQSTAKNIKEPFNE